MEKAEWDALQTTLARVKKTMDQRFEKDAELYIDQPNIEWLKRKLHGKNYDAVKDRMASGLAPEALTRVIIENAWLLPNDTRPNAYRSLFDVIKKCRRGYLNRGDLVTGVLDDSYDMPEAFRTELAELCLSKIDGLTAQAMLRNGAEKLPFLNNPRLWLACLGTALYQLDPMEKYRQFTAYVENKAEAYAQTQWSGLDRIFDRSSINDNVLDAAFNDHFMKDHSPGYYYWRYVFGQRSVPDALAIRAERVFLANSADFKVCKRLWSCVAPAIFRSESIDAMLRVFSKVAPQWHANRLDKLGEIVTGSLSTKKPEFASKVAKIFNDSGMNIDVKKNDDLPDLNGIFSMLNEANITDGKIYFLTKAFKHWYRKDSPVEHLKELKEMAQEGCAERNFESFCYKLVNNVPYPFVLPYMIYVMDNFQNQTATNLIIKVIQKEDIFHSRPIKDYKDDLNRLKSFVQEKDFELYKKLMS